MARLQSFGVSVLENRYLSSWKLNKSMRHLSSGTRIDRPGDAPSDYGIS